MGRKEEIGLRIRTMRKSRDMTQDDLARAIGQSPSSITMYETGRREPDFETLEALADVFNVPLIALVENESRSEERPRNDRVRVLLRGFNRLSDDELDRATEMMRLMFARNAEFFKENGDET